MDLIAPGPAEARLAGMLKALGHPLRLAILTYVADHQGCICNEVVLRTGRAQSTVSQHLAVLTAAGLIEAQHDGHTTSYFLDRDAVRWMLTTLQAEIAHHA